MNEDQSSSSWKTVLLIVLGIAAVVIIALLLSQIDLLQKKSTLPSNGPKVVDIEATVRAGEFETIYLPSDASPTPTVTIQATPTIAKSEIEESPITTPTAAAEIGCGESPESLTAYIVKRGDNLISIATNYRVSVDDLMQVNCLNYDQIIEGQQIYLPNTMFLNQVQKHCKQPANWEPYIIQPGETVEKLARAHGMRAFTIIKANCLEEFPITIGSKIYLPASMRNLSGLVGSNDMQSECARSNE